MPVATADEHATAGPSRCPQIGPAAVARSGLDSRPGTDDDDGLTPTLRSSYNSRRYPGSAGPR
jgi:hypothetical protein